MDADRVARTAALLAETEYAHGAYEAEELNGVYDQAWPSWYASYAVEHGLADVLGRSVDAETTAAFLERTYAEYEATDPPPAAPWAEFLARRMVEEL